MYVTIEHHHTDVELIIKAKSWSIKIGTLMVKKGKYRRSYYFLVVVKTRSHMSNARSEQGLSGLKRIIYNNLTLLK